jgi:hypothetical protein
MKKLSFIVYFSTISLLSVAASKSINEKLVQSFRETYPNAVQVSWKEYPETYAVYFAEEGIKATIIFKKDGTFLKSTRYYQEEFLPYYLVAAIKEKFPEESIYGITEITSPFSIEYYIKLEDQKNWRTVKLESDGSIKVVEKFRKA